MRVIAIVNQKGGCGKTTTAVNLAAVLARDGGRTLLVDMDPQSHCAAGLGVPDQTLDRTIGEAMLADHDGPPDMEDFLWEVGRNLKLAPSSVALAALEAPNGPLAARHDRDRRLGRLLAAWRDGFDWCIIDCPPTIGLLTFNALRASDLVLVPVETGYFSLKGAERQIETIEAVVRRFGRDIPFRLLPTLVNDSRALSRDVVASLAKRFPEALLPFSVREHEELRDAASYGQAITEFAPGSAAESDFNALAAWLGEFLVEGRALADFGGFDPPLIETFQPAATPPAFASEPPAAARFSDGAGLLMPAASLAPSASLASSASLAPAPVQDRATELAARLRGLNDRARSVPAGGGFGVRATREGVVLFMQPLSARETSVVGDFNGWIPGLTPLRPSADRTRLEAVIELAPGRHAYRIVVDGTETLDEFNLHRLESSGAIGANLVEVPVPSDARAGATAYGERTR
jgi:chromosome partitioning protein